MTTLTEFGSLVRSQRQKAGLTLDALSRATGISKPYLSNIETGAAPGPPSGPKLAILETTLGFPHGFLAHQADLLRTPASIRQLLGDAPTPLPRHANGTVDLDAMLGGKNGLSSRRANMFPAGVPLVATPLINAVPAGRAAEYTDLDYPAGVADRFIAAPAVSVDAFDSGADTGGQTAAQNAAAMASMFALRIVGDSMSPQYADGEIVVFSGNQKAADGDDCLVRLDQRENFATTFKRVFFIANPTGSAEAAGEMAVANPAADADPTHVRLLPLNPAHATRTIALEETTGIYPAVWKISAVRNARGAARPAGEEASAALGDQRSGETEATFLEQD